MAINDYRSGFAMLSGLFEAARIIPSRLAAPDHSLALTLLSGFLGSGKTTFVNRLLAEPGGRRIMVIVNDFGAIDIDSRLIRSRGADTISLANGCACCTISSNLTQTFVRIAEAADRPDVILLEPSGLADPGAIIQIALANPALRLDGVITLIDGDNILAQLADETIGPLIRAQVRAANIVVLNKIDLLWDRAGDVRRAIAAMAADRPVIEAKMADVPVSIVFGLRAEGENIATGDATFDAKTFVTRSFEWQAPLRKTEIQCVLQALPPRTLRAKGIFAFVGEEHPHIYHRVGGRWSWTVEASLAANSAESKLVVIATAAQAAPIDRVLAELPSGV